MYAISRVTLENLGFSCSGRCKICSSHYDVFVKPGLADLEVKVRARDGYTRIFQSGKQIAFCHSDKIIQTLLHHEIIQRPDPAIQTGA